LSKRSLVAVPTFMVTAGLTASGLGEVDLSKLWFAKFSERPAELSLTSSAAIVTAIGTGTIVHALVSTYRRQIAKREEGLGSRIVESAVTEPGLACHNITNGDLSHQSAPQKKSTDIDSVAAALACVLSGALFAAGLVISHMCNPTKVLAFLQPFASAGWDPSLAFTMAAALAITTPTFQTLPPPSKSTPLLLSSWDIPSKSTPVSWSLVVGAAVFGVGWGMCGVCPGPAVLALVSGSPCMIVFFVIMYVTLNLTRNINWTAPSTW